MADANFIASIPNGALSNCKSHQQTFYLAEVDNLIAVSNMIIKSFGYSYVDHVFPPSH